MRVAPINLILSSGASSGSMAGDLTFGIINNRGVFGGLNLDQVYGYCIQANYLTGAPAGTLKLQASIDGTNFADIDGSEFTISGTGTTIWNVSSSNYLYVRMIWTADPGSTGTLAALAYTRGF